MTIEYQPLIFNCESYLGHLGYKKFLGMRVFKKSAVNLWRTILPFFFIPESYLNLFFKIMYFLKVFFFLNSYQVVKFYFQHIHTTHTNIYHTHIYKYTVVICILIVNCLGCWVKQCQVRLTLEWVAILVCQFLMVVFRMRL